MQNPTPAKLTSVAEKTEIETPKPILYKEAHIHIDAPPQLVYELISDVTRMGEWSPECYRCIWLNGATAPVVGARFKGYNKYKGFGWSREAEIIVAEPGREFVFRTIPKFLYRDSTDWRYSLKSIDGGTELSESFSLTFAWLPIRFVEFKTSRPEDTHQNMMRTLERIKARAEAIARGN